MHKWWCDDDDVTELDLFTNINNDSAHTQLQPVQTLIEKEKEIEMEQQKLKKQQSKREVGSKRPSLSSKQLSTKSDKMSETASVTPTSDLDHDDEAWRIILKTNIFMYSNMLFKHNYFMYSNTLFEHNFLFLYHAEYTVSIVSDLSAHVLIQIYLCFCLCMFDCISSCTFRSILITVIL